MIWAIGLLVLLLALSALCSGAEIAFFSVPLSLAKEMEEDGRRGGQALVRVKESPERLLITILLGNSIGTVGAAVAGTWIAATLFEPAGAGIAIGGLILLILLVGEIVPKGIGVANAVHISLGLAPAFRIAMGALFFIVRPLERLVRVLVPEAEWTVPHVTEGEIRQLTLVGHEAGSIELHERELIERAFALDDLHAWEVMTPRTEMFAWSASRPLASIAQELRSVPYSRIPVHDDSLDEITGVLYVRDAYQALIGGQRDVTLGELAREPFFVPASVSLVKLLAEFQQRRIHVGIVVDEYGGTDGLITLEDILEELVGEIADERDLPEEPIVRVGRSQVLVDGSVDLKEINHFFNTSFPMLEHRSLNGYLLEELGHVPEEGEVVEREAIRIEVLEATETLVTKARLTRVTVAPRGA